MIRVIKTPAVLAAAGEPPKRIEEFIGRVNTPDFTLASLARMISPEGWSEPGQKPEFDEFTFVLRGVLDVETINGGFTVCSGEAMISPKGEWVRYSTPSPGGAEYLAVCVPAFSPDQVHRDADGGRKSHEAALKHGSGNDT